MVAVLTPDDVSRLVGRVTFERGLEYATRGNVASVAHNAEGSTIVGQVRGSGGKHYVSVVHMTGPGSDAVPRFGQCSCPVQLDCKHVAATLLSYIDRQTARAGGNRPAESEWETELSALLAPAEAAPAPTSDLPRPFGRARELQTTPVALQLEVLAAAEPGRYGRGTRVAEGPRLGMRPVTLGSKGRWVRTGMGWDRVANRYHYADRFPEAHVDLLRTIRALARSETAYSQPRYLYADDMPGTALFGVLDEAQRAGLPIVGSDKDQREVTYVTEPARTRLDLTRSGDGLALTATVDVGGGLALRDVRGDGILTREHLSLLGPAPAGAFVWSGDVGRAVESPITLVRFATPPDATVEALLRRDGPLVVPAPDEQRFLVRALPALRGRVDELRIDPSIDAPAPPRPVLWLAVAREAGHRTHLAWQWRYVAAEGDEPLLTVPLGSPTDDLLRDTAAERALLARVSDDVPRLRDALTSGRARLTLEGLDTAAFFTDELPALQALADAGPDLGVTVTVADDAPDDVEYRLVEDIEVSVSTLAREGDRDWFDLAVTVRSGEQTIPFGEIFRALARGETYLLLVDGRHFSLEDERFTRLRELIEEARALQDTMGGTLRVNRFQAGLFDELEGLGLVGSQADDWRSAVGALAGGGTVASVPQPPSLRAELRPYQQTGFDWLAFLHAHRLGGVLADDMGLGKTLQGLALIQHTRDQALAEGRVAAPVLVVAPTSVVGNWVAEAKVFTPDLAATAIAETRARRRTPLADAVRGADVVVTSYALFRLEFDAYAELEWSTLILDEAQFVKNHQSVAYQCARRLDAPVKIAMTGTPLENNLMELWSILSITSPGLFPSPRRFADYYAKPIEKEHDDARLDQLRRRIAPFMVRRTKEEVATDLPVKQEQVTEVTLNSRHRKIYDQYLQRERTKVLGIMDEFADRRFEVFRSLSVLRQASLDVSLVDEAHAGVPSSKIDVLFEMLEDILAEGHSVLIFSQFTQFLKRVRDRLDADAVGYAYLDGRTRKRAEAIARFTSGEANVFLISLKAGGFGLNLTAADYCILLDPWWNPAAEAQAVDRAHRIGQKRNVMVYRMVATQTIEEKVMALKASKSALFSSVLDGGAAGGAGLTAEDVTQLLT
ncbi:DNA helicase [Flavimobilis marinus]|uniref:SWIM zinc finger n=1 Tax=Flavimobilis marinus TaxID=285351 RepID=A0A1I2D2A6_9MICO|nr:DNA helicase [Flavimobilis marinus]SFE74615.1 SWIM zinc finger [Flavimobilis marinus]